MSFIPDLSFFLVAIPAVMISGIGKGGMGTAMGILAVPLMSLVMPPLQAAAILLPLLMVMDGFAIWGWRNHVDWRMMRMLLPAGLLGILIGVLTFYRLPDSSVRILIGALSILFCLHQWLFKQVKPGSQSRIKGTFWATVSGFTSFGLHAGGAPLSIYMLPLKMDKQVLAGTMAVFFGILNVVKLPAYGTMGQFDSESLLLSLMLLPFCPLSVKLGMKLVSRIREDIFYRFLYFGLFLTGMKLIAG
ncbi:MAG: sulfite exporter TauE/SafE family protein [Endozoicomonas sp.]